MRDSVAINYLRRPGQHRAVESTREFSGNACARCVIASMAEYVAVVRNRCADESPDFLEFDSVCAPPVDFGYALIKAR